MGVSYWTRQHSGLDRYTRGRVTATPRAPSSPGLTPAPPCGAQEISSDGKFSHIFKQRERERDHTRDHTQYFIYYTLVYNIYIYIKKYIYIYSHFWKQRGYTLYKYIYMWWYPNWLQKWLLETTSPWWTCKAAVLRQEFRLFIGPSLAPWWDLNNWITRSLHQPIPQHPLNGCHADLPVLTWNHSHALLTE